MAEAAAALRTVAHNVRVARVRAGLSLDELSRRAQVSKGALVGLEKAQGNPNLTTLVRLADTLGISVSALMQGAPEGRVRVTTIDDVAPLWTGEHGSEARLIDLAVFADTGWEPRPVYAHLAWLRAHAHAHGIPVRTVSAGNIHHDALDPDHRFASMPLHVLHPDGSRGLARRQCSVICTISRWRHRPPLRRLP